MKGLALAAIAWLLGQLCRKYLLANPDIRVVVVAGSIGKTSTKAAIATVLSAKYKVRSSRGNLNTVIAVPLSVMGVPYPDYSKIASPITWFRTFRKVRARVRKPDSTEVIVQELGIDHPGDMRKFGRLLRADLAVVTAITPEHMEFFKTIETVAREEMRVADFSGQLLVNSSAVAAKFVPKGAKTYGKHGDYSFDDIRTVKLRTIGKPARQVALAAYAVGDMMGMEHKAIVKVLSEVVSEPGRMNLLDGKNGAQIIDSSYNSSPEALRAALDTLYDMPAKNRIAILGSMNELGEKSADYHREIGESLDPRRLDVLIVMGDEAVEHLVPAARGIKNIIVAGNAKEAGEAALSLLNKDTIVLVKGSQGGIFLEEATKILLRDKSDEKQLVRQSEAWMAKKRDMIDK